MTDGDMSNRFEGLTTLSEVKAAFRQTMKVPEGELLPKLYDELISQVFFIGRRAGHAQADYLLRKISRGVNQSILALGEKLDPEESEKAD